MNMGKRKHRPTPLSLSGRDRTSGTHSGWRDGGEVSGEGVGCALCGGNFDRDAVSKEDLDLKQIPLASSSCDDARAASYDNENSNGWDIDLEAALPLLLPHQRSHGSEDARRCDRAPDALFDKEFECEVGTDDAPLLSSSRTQHRRRTPRPTSLAELGKLPYQLCRAAGDALCQAKTGTMTTLLNMEERFIESVIRVCDHPPDVETIAARHRWTSDDDDDDEDRMRFDERGALIVDDATGPGAGSGIKGGCGETGGRGRPDWGWLGRFGVLERWYREDMGLGSS